MSNVAVVAGVGGGFGETLVRRLASEGYAVACFARSEDYLASLETDLREAGHDALAVPTDLRSPDEITAGFREIRNSLGPVDVLVYNPSVPAPGHLFDVDRDDFEAVYEVVLRGGFLAAREAIGDMRERDGGTVIFTGTSMAKRAFGNLLAWDMAGPALRGLAQSLVHRFGSEGVHVAYVLVDGAIGGPGESDVPRSPDELISPTAMADVYCHLIEQDRRGWTFELDLRASGDRIRI
ncbi:SDR family NAD(P)-dependent oxidoreductase [Halococcus agarilyticus]|uniref:SDR family NAD(P)-dependent oxidoreductase n=1 Tax=Halococcus agarilyticus TaxID=1232219 RepID=UPI000677D0BC|nr:SDR family NAD(P)-dependent oxidoreductase [Halococcus agarilyticus]